MLFQQIPERNKLKAGHVLAHGFRGFTPQSVVSVVLSLHPVVAWCHEGELFISWQPFISRIPLSLLFHLALQLIGGRVNIIRYSLYLPVHFILLGLQHLIVSEKLSQTYAEEHITSNF